MVVSITVRLDRPPQVANVGVGLHGVKRDRDVFRLPDLWQLHLYQYVAELTVDGTPYPIRPGHVSLVPPGAVVQYRYQGRSQHLYAHLRLGRTGEPRSLPIMQDAGAETPILSALLLSAIAAWSSAPRRTESDVWAALWRVASLAAPSRSERPHAAVAAAVAYIESHLAGPLAVPDIAAAAGVSHNHLTRLFRAETGDTIVAHVRRRRMERARHLLRESTLPIASIATAVGIGDLQAFNKTCRRELGTSPRALRAQ
ncbi:AraC family transcriptional regulator [Tenggerimyces flavus]|uniref:Helix-turn-helix domain-containing protein n=1 Tax=Tenggerimyces flavus TaxID=1708749 RepID=A0ABV7YCX5_9ACTN|nr:AraC family transcriptional regulator [Tenggerimyces flavus]MBM7788141.1 AraC-like DNA-binding protein [Tenggerimyces flavus]